MKLTFLGSGSAFCVDNYQSNMMIEKNGKKLLIDCGGDIRWSLKEKGLTVSDIDGIYISHAHNDHIGGLECVAFSTYFNPNIKPIKLYGEGEMLDDIWDKSLTGGLNSIQGQKVGLDDYFDVQRIKKNDAFTWQGIKFQMIQVVHVMAEFSVVHSYGLLFKGDKGKEIFITTDTQFCPAQIKTFYERADYIFQDCETSPFLSGVHAHYTELVGLNKDFKKKMHLYHYQDGKKADCKKDGFAEWVTKGQEYEL
jgi:ribonuclease BN (tRNA processing enzyme)